MLLPARPICPTTHQNGRPRWEETALIFGTTLVIVSRGRMAISWRPSAVVAIFVSCAGESPLDDGTLDRNGTYLQLVAVLEERSMEEFDLDIAECVSDECEICIN